MKTRKLFTMILVIGMLTSCSIYGFNTFGGGVIEAQAASKKAMKKAALKAYKTILQKDIATIEENVLSVKEIQFAILDVNHDGIPELYRTQSNEAMKHSNNTADESLYTFYKGKAKVVAESFHIAAESPDFTFYKKGSVYNAVWKDHGTQHTDTYKIIKGKRKLVAQCIDDTNASGAVETESNGNGITYKAGNKKVSAKKYKSYIKKLTKGSLKQNIKLQNTTKKNVKKYAK